MTGGDVPTPERFVIHEEGDGWYIRDMETDERLPTDEAHFFTFRPTVETVAWKLNTMAAKRRPDA